MMTGQALLALLVAVPTVSGLLILILAREPGREWLARGLAVLSCLLVPVALAATIYFQPRAAVELAAGMRLSFGLDHAGIMFAVLTSGLWILSVIYCLGYMTPQKTNNGRFFGYFTLSQASVLGIAMSQNLLTLYVFYEALTLLTYPLVTHKGDSEALSAGRMYIAYSLLGAGLVLAAMVGLQASYGELAFGPGGALGSVPSPAMIPFLLALVLGFGVKAAIMPLHSWLPRAMVAPTPVSALLHAVAVVKSGVFGIFRVVFGVYGAGLLTDLGIGPTLTGLCLVTIIVGSILALYQDVLKRRLAYSTISQLAYITLGASLLTPSALAGAWLHLVNHALLKCILFFSAGVIMTQGKVDRISQLGGSARRFPVTMACFAIASLGLVGVLPTNGFLGKWYLVTGALEGGQWAAAAALAVSALLCALYLLPIVIRAYLGSGEWQRPEIREAPATMLWPIMVLAAISLTIGLVPGPLLRAAQWAAAGMLGIPAGQ